MPGLVESSYPCHNTGDVDEPEYNEHIHETTEGMEDSQDLSDHDQPFTQEMKLEDDEPFSRPEPQIYSMRRISAAPGNLSVRVAPPMSVYRALYSSANSFCLEMLWSPRCITRPSPLR